MDEDQTYVFNLAMGGHNVVMTGQAGTGKSFVISKLVKEMRKGGAHVALTCSTGISATLYEKDNLGACTIHKWAGIEDGRHDNDVLCKLIMNDERFVKVKDNITSTTCLIIDEISMISANTFKQIEFICQGVRGNSMYFGGLQVILAGDFYQLAPVRNELYGDFGHHCISAPWFYEAFPHRLNLNIIHRQNDPVLITAVNELERGVLSADTIGFVDSLSRELPPDAVENAVHLFARNIDADVFNYNKIQNCPGQLHVFPSVDEGDTHYLHQFLAPKHLGLKENTPVMLLTNLSDSLVNGKIGRVSKIETHKIYVDFDIDNKKKQVAISKFTFTKFDPVRRCTIAKRTQFPLKLAFSLTIHKSQGMSIDTVVVDCKNATNPGQIGVAVGRATHVDGLMVKNFKASSCRSHPQCVDKYYQMCTAGDVQDDKTCCVCVRDSNQIKPVQDDGKGDDGSGDDNDDDDDSDGGGDQKDQCSSDDGQGPRCESDLSDVEEDVLMLIDELDQGGLDTAKEILTSCVDEFIDTPLNDAALAFKQDVLKNRSWFLTWYNKQCKRVDEISKQHFPSEKSAFPAKHISSFYTEFNTHITTDEFRASTDAICQIYPTADKDASFRVLVSVMFYIQKQILLEVNSRTAKTIPDMLPKIAADSVLSGPGRGKIRYISGYVVAKIKYRNSKLLRNNLFKPGKEQVINSAQLNINLLDRLCTTDADIDDTCSDPHSLLETKRKQNASASLCTVTDNTFDFFKELELKTRTLLTYQNLQEQSSNMYSFVESNCIADATCLTSFASLFDCVLNEEMEEKEPHMYTAVTSLHNKVICLFVKVSVCQFRRDFLTALKVEKGKALRQKIKTKMLSKPKCLNMSFIEKDQSKGKDVSHLRLKSELLVNPQFLHQNLSKNDLLKICKAYGVTISSKKKKTEIGDALAVKILGVATMPNAEVLTVPRPGSSGVDTAPHPGPSGGVTGPQPGPSGAITGSRPGSSRVDTGPHPGPSGGVTGPQPGPSGAITGSRPGSSRVDTGPQPGPSGVITGSRPGSSGVDTGPTYSETEHASVDQPTVPDREGFKKVKCVKGKGKRARTTTTCNSRKKSKGQQRRKQVSSSDDSDEKCAVCNNLYIEGEQWICCDSCALWLHRECARLEDDDEWELFSGENQDYHCPFCQ
jgi:ATP-dependent DNA helicase PIF1